MGLDTTHDCWHGPYSSFHDWRVALALAAGIPDLMQMEGYLDSEYARRFDQSDVLTKLLHHSDCEGEIASVDCGPLADRLAELLPNLPDNEYVRQKTQQFIDGLRRAAAAGEDVEFH